MDLREGMKYPQNSTLKMTKSGLKKRGNKKGNRQTLKVVTISYCYRSVTTFVTTLKSADFQHYRLCW